MNSLPKFLHIPRFTGRAGMALANRTTLCGRLVSRLGMVSDPERATCPRRNVEHMTATGRSWTDFMPKAGGSK